MNKVKKNRHSRSMIERVQAIFDLIGQEELPLAKTTLSKIGLSPATAEKWFNLIIFIQNQPKIRLIKTKRYTFVEPLESKYQLMSLKNFLDPRRPLEERLKSIEDYTKSLLFQERLFNRQEDDAEKRTTEIIKEKKDKTEEIKRIKENRAEMIEDTLKKVRKIRQQEILDERDI